MKLTDSEGKFARIALHGVPRSGTTWLGEIINSSPNTIYRFQPLFSYVLKEFLTPSSTGADIRAFYDRLATTFDPFLEQTEARSSGRLPTFQKERATHVAYKEVRYHGILPNLLRGAADVRVILIVRNPVSCISSWLSAPKEFRQDLGWQAAEEWRYASKKNRNRPEEYNGFERWKEATRLFVALAEIYPDRVYLCHYRDLLADPAAETQRLFDFCALSMQEQTRAFLEASRSTSSDDPYSVYRDRNSDQRSSPLAEEIASAMIDDLRGTPLEVFLYQTQGQL